MLHLCLSRPGDLSIALVRNEMLHAVETWPMSFKVLQRLRRNDCAIDVDSLEAGCRGDIDTTMMSPGIPALPQGCPLVSLGVATWATCGRSSGHFPSSRDSMQTCAAKDQPRIGELHVRRPAACVHVMVIKGSYNSLSP